MIRLLSLETSTDRGAFCLWSGEATAGVPVTLGARTERCPTGQPHAETLLPLLRQALNETGWALETLDAVVVDAGPGMFTGLRVSAALAQGLAVAANKPIIAISSLEALVESGYSQSGQRRVLTLLDARMNQIYAAAWERSAEGSWQAILAPCLVDPQALCDLDLAAWKGEAAGAIPVAIAGTALEVYPEAAQWCEAQGWSDTGVRYPEAEAVASLGAQRLLRGEIQDAADALPVYVRDRVALTSAERAAGLSL